MGIPLYIVLWLIVPSEGLEEEGTVEEHIRSGASEIAEQARSMGDDLRESVRHPNPQAGLIVGGALVLLGVFMLVGNIVPWLWWWDFDVLWPLLLVVGGLVLLLRRVKGE